MLSFELDKEMEKDVLRLVTSVGQIKKNLSPHEESNLRPSDSPLLCFTSEPQRLYGGWGLLRSSYETLHTARIYNVDSVMFVNNVHGDSEFCLGPKLAIRRKTSFSILLVKPTETYLSDIASSISISFVSTYFDISRSISCLVSLSNIFDVHAWWNSADAFSLATIFFGTEYCTFLCDIERSVWHPWTVTWGSTSNRLSSVSKLYTVVLPFFSLSPVFFRNVYTRKVLYVWAVQFSFRL